MSKFQPIAEREIIVRRSPRGSLGREHVHMRDTVTAVIASITHSEAALASTAGRDPGYVEDRSVGVESRRR